MFTTGNPKFYFLKSPGILFFFNFIFIFIAIKLAPSFYGDLIFDYDSENYISSPENRLSIYPFILDIFGEKNFKNLINFQILFFSLSVAYLVQKVIKKLKLFFTIIFLLTILLNFFYLSFCKVILTEGFFFSLVNFILALFFDLDDKKKNKTSLLISLCCGALISIRPEGIILGTVFFCFIFIIHKIALKFFLINLSFFLIFPLLENFIYYQKYDERKSVFNYIVAGKLYMISSSERFKFSDFSEFNNNFLEEVVKSSRDVQNFVKNFKNPYLKSNLITDYEAISQYELHKMINLEKQEIDKNLDNLTLKTYLNIIFKYPFEYLNITFHHYLTMCTPGGRIFFLENEAKKKNLEIPYNQSFKNLSGNIALERLNKNLIFVTIFTLIFMFFYFLMTINSLFKILKKREISLINLIIIAAQIHLISVSFLNIGSVRYVMPVYSIITLSTLVYFKNFFYNLRHEK